MILVAGGTGRLGREVVDRLVRQGNRVRVLTRHPAAARDRLPDAIEVAQGDVRDASAIRAAAQGAAVVVSAVHGLTGTRGSSPATVDRDGNANLVDAALQIGARVVMLSIVGATTDSAVELFRLKAAAEDHLWRSGVPATVVRATAYTELHVETLERSARGGRPVVLGRGDRPQNLVSVHDVAAVVCWAVDDPLAKGRTVDVVGPDNLTMTELAEAVQQANGWSGSPRHIPVAVLRLAASTVGLVLPPVRRVVATVLSGEQLDLTAQHSDAPSDVPAATTTVAAVLLAAKATRQRR